MNEQQEDMPTPKPQTKSAVLEWGSRIVVLLSSIGALASSLNWSAAVLSYVFIGVAVLFIGEAVIRRMRGAIQEKTTGDGSVSRSSAKLRVIGGGAILALVVAAAALGSWYIRPVSVRIVQDNVGVTSVMQASNHAQVIQGAIGAYVDEEQNGLEVTAAERDVLIAAARESFEDETSDAEVRLFVLGELGKYDVEDVSPYELSIPVHNTSNRAATLTGIQFVVEHAVYMKMCPMGAAGEEEFADVAEFSILLDPTPETTPDYLLVNELRISEVIEPGEVRLFTFFLRNETSGTDKISLGLYDLEVMLEFANGARESTKRVLVAVPTLTHGLRGTGLDPDRPFLPSEPCHVWNLCAAMAFFGVSEGELLSSELRGIQAQLSELGEDAIRQYCPES
jgi:hypothetical protein